MKKHFKKNIKKSISALAIGILLFVVGCDRDELIQEQKTENLRITALKKATLIQVLSKVQNPIIKEKIEKDENLYVENIIQKNNSIFRYSIPDSIFTIIESNNFTSYLLPLNSYSTEKPYFLKLAISIDTNNNESVGYIKYLPSNPQNSIEIDTYTGKLQILNIDEEIIASTDFENGIAITSPEGSPNQRVICNETISIVPIICEEGGNHGPGQTCEDGIQRGGWGISISSDCNFVFPTQHIVQIIDDTNSGSNGSGSVNVGAALANDFAESLSTEQQAIYFSNPSLAEYFANNIEVVNNPNYNPLIANGNDGATMVIIKPEAEQFVNELIEYATQNNNTTISQFINWAIDYKNNNPNVTNEQFKNWFMTKREGKDYYYDEAFWENPNLTFPQQNLPTWDNFDNAYPRNNTTALITIVGGDVEDAYNDYPSLVRGGCALKVSRALNYSGVIIPQITTTAGNPGTIQGADGKYYFLNAKALNKWMRKTFGTNPTTASTPFNSNHIHLSQSDGGINGVNFPNLVNGIKGIFSMVSTNANWASGHADLINDKICVFGCHFQDTPPAPIDYIDIWILD